MTPNRKLLKRIGFVCLLLCLCLAVAACDKSGSATTPTASETGKPTENVTYEIAVESNGGTGLSGLELYVYDSAAKENLIALLTTDESGKASFTYTSGEGYIVELGNVPDSYRKEAYYTITGASTKIVLEIQIVDGDLNTVTYKLGDVMGDFTFTDCDGNAYKLSELLKEKKAVVLKFWTMNQNASKTDFSSLQEIYEEISGDVAILAMNPTETEQANVAAFRDNMGITFPIGICDEKWMNAMSINGYPTTVVIDRFGTVALRYSASLDSAVKHKDIFAYFTAEGYTQSIVEDYNTLLVTKDDSEVENPVEVGGTTSFQLTLKPGKVHYIDIYKVTDVWLQVNNEDIYVEYGSKTYTATDGSVGLMISAPSTFEPAQLGFGNSGEETVTITVEMSNLEGSFDNPFTVQLGEFTANVAAGNNQGVYYLFTAEEDGYLSLQCIGITPELKYDFAMMNLTTSAMRSVADDGETSSDTGNPVVTMAMNKGEQVRITISVMPDEYNNYPAATFQMLATFTAGEVEDIVEVEKVPYGVTITDENKQPIAGVNITLVGTANEGNKPTRLNIVTDENGVASGYFPKDSYTGSIVIPGGYLAGTTTFTLTPDAPYVSLKLDTHIILMEDYTVRVVDEEGLPISGVLITIGSIFGNTDADGVFTANLEKNSYTALIGVPEGYKADAISVPFPEDSTTLNITLKKSSGDEVSGVEYVVKVVDANGTGISDILVTFLLDGDLVTMVPVNAMGVATTRLEAAVYTIKLTSADGAALKFDANQATLTEEKLATTIIVATDISGNQHESAYWGSYYKITTGSSWVNLNQNTNYVEEFGTYMFVFYPSGSGIYRFSVSEGASLGLYGSVNFPNGPSRDTLNEDGYFEQSVRESEFANDNQPAMVIGLKVSGSIREATITVVRVGDAPKEMTEVDYVPTCEIENFVLTESGKINYVDLRGTADIEKRSDGFYYLNGKKLYMNLSYEAPYLTMANMLGIIYDVNTGEWTTSSMGTGMKGLIYEDNIPVAIEDYTTCMSDYVRASDPMTGLYALNDDLIYMIKSCGSYMGWWNPDSPNYRFEALSGLNVDIAWMFAVCTVG